jgi:hypothetical protein
MTPPTSGGVYPTHSDREAFSGNPSFSSGLMGQQGSPTIGMEGKGSGAGNNKGGSYADFWSKIGNVGPTQSGERQ